ncbi:MAG: hypothetical protein ACK5P5_05285 [Pseudobdellovibrionaceae bacterium]
MGSLAPIIEFLFLLRKTLEKGHPTKKAIEIYLQSAQSSDFKLELIHFHVSQTQGQPINHVLFSSKFRLRRQLWVLMDRSRQGEPILPFLLALEAEALATFEDIATQNTQKLPFLMMIPLLLFQFPAFGLLILGPLLDIFLHSMN